MPRTRKQTSRKTAKKLIRFNPTLNAVSSAFRKTIAPLRGAKIPAQLQRFPFARRITFGTIALLLLLLLASLGLFLFGNQLILAWQERTAAAVVNGETIGKGELERRLIQSYGDDTVQKLIDEVLILQEGRQQKITVTDQETADKVSVIEKQIAPEKLDDALAARKLTRGDLGRQIQIQVMTEKVLGKDISLTDKDIADYFNENKESLAQDAGKKVEELKLVDVRQTVVEQLRARRISAKYRPWIEELRSKSSIRTFVKA